MKSVHSKEPESARRTRWASQHGGRDEDRPRKKAWDSIRAALAASERPGYVGYEPYRCRWHDEYARGETAPEHFHIGRSLTGIPSSGRERTYRPLTRSLADAFPPHLLGGIGGA